MGATREDPFIKQFLSAYEHGTWADADVLKPDAIDRTNPAVDQIATRKRDGRTLAIEHTIIEPFVQEKEDFASFSRADFLSIENDPSLPVPGIWIEVFVPVGTLQNQLPAARAAIVQSVHDWIKANRLTLPEGSSQQPCAVNGTPAKITLTVRVTPLRRGDKAEPGALHIRRQQIDNNLGDVIEKALRKKLPKLVNTPSDKRILLLERQHMNLLPESMLAEIETRRASFPELAKVNEIWIIETIFYGTAGGTYLRFELYKNGHVTRSYDFKDGKLLTRFEGGFAEVVNHIS
ncbi:MAG: hypothetical protein IT161_14780 [Bryobacterales bacterium]|nr:hypothetical protein [Bryobacterales bacterium]